LPSDPPSTVVRILVQGGNVIDVKQAVTLAEKYFTELRMLDFQPPTCSRSNALAPLLLCP
jgi:hypothetical protein